MNRNPLRDHMSSIISFAAESYVAAGWAGFWLPTRRLDDGRWVLRWQYCASEVRHG